jgi:hypothetical protein
MPVAAWRDTRGRRPCTRAHGGEQRALSPPADRPTDPPRRAARLASHTDVQPKAPAAPLAIDHRFTQRSEGASCCERSSTFPQPSPSDRSTPWPWTVKNRRSTERSSYQGPVPERVRFTSIVRSGRSDQLARVPVSLPFASTATRRHHVDIAPDLGRSLWRTKYVVEAYRSLSCVPRAEILQTTGSSCD